MLSLNYLESKVKKALIQAWPVVSNNWHLGMTAFGGPPVHFKIVRIKTTIKLNCNLTLKTAA
jgi:hypothetical protein